MKKKILFLCSWLCYSVILAQAPFLNQFDNREDVKSVTVNKKMFDIMSKIDIDKNDQEAQKYLNLLKKLDYLKIITTSNSSVSKELLGNFSTYTTTNSFEQLVKSTNGDKNNNVYIKKIDNTSSNIKELLLITENKTTHETMTMLLTGNFTLEEVALLTNKMKIPWMKEKHE